MATLGRSYVVYQGNKILIVDSLPKENAQNVIKIDRKGINISNSGIYGDFVTVWKNNGTYDFTPFNYVKWGNINIGKANDVGVKLSFLLILMSFLLNFLKMDLNFFVLTICIWFLIENMFLLFTTKTII